VTTAIERSSKVRFLPKQREFMEAMDPEVVYSGAFGAGKTRVGNEKALFLSLKYPGNVGAIVRKSFSHLRVTTMANFFDYVCPESFIKHQDKETWTFTLQNGSKIMFLGLDQKSSSAGGPATKIGSLEVGWIFVDECIELTEAEWGMLLGRIRKPDVPFRQIFGATNPDSPTHWMYRRGYIDKAIRMIQSSTLENSYLPQDYIERLSRLKGIYYDRYVLGDWVGAEGLVYGDVFDPRKHVIDSFPIPDYWEHYRSIDFGFTNPFVCQWWARPPKQEYGEENRPWYLYRELYMTNKTVEEHAKVIRDYTEETILCTITDWDAEDRKTLEKAGIPSIKAVKDISPGIQEVHTQVGEDRVYIFRDGLIEEDSVLSESGKPVSTASEFSMYKWPEHRLKLNEKEVPADRDNHGMDAMRYMLWYMSPWRRQSGRLRGRVQSAPDVASGYTSGRWGGSSVKWGPQSDDKMRAWKTSFGA
jgi:PBSX family phage terminase large subunit